MAVLAERKVQEVALRFLEKKYRRPAIRSRIFAKEEMGTKQKYGGKRADGFLAFRHYFLGNYTVSLEAKSAKTLSAIQPHRDYYILLKNSVRFGFWVCLGSGALIAGVKLDDQLWQFLIPLYTFFLSGLAYALLTWNGVQHQTMRVISQLKQYPANRQWLAFSKDSFDQLSRIRQRNLEKICQNRGIGVLIVGRRTKVLCRPQYRWSFGEDFLRYYSKEKEVRNYLDN